jgi:hypothetical protein
LGLLPTNGLCNLRFDDTNPSKEEVEYESIQAMCAGGFDWDNRLFYASDYFEQYEYAVQLIKRVAYVCDLSAEIRTDYQQGKDKFFTGSGMSLRIGFIYPAGRRIPRGSPRCVPDRHGSPNITLRDRSVSHPEGLPPSHWRSVVYLPDGDFTIVYRLHRRHHLYLYIEVEIIAVARLGADQLEYHPQQIEFARLNTKHG